MSRPRNEPGGPPAPEGKYILLSDVDANQFDRGRRFFFVTQEEYDWHTFVNEILYLVAKRKVEENGTTKYSWWSRKVVLTYRGVAYGHPYMQFCSEEERKWIKEGERNWRPV